MRGTARTVPRDADDVARAPRDDGCPELHARGHRRAGDRRDRVAGPDSRARGRGSLDRPDHASTLAVSVVECVDADAEERGGPGCRSVVRVVGSTDTRMRVGQRRDDPRAAVVPRAPSPQTSRRGTLGTDPEVGAQVDRAVACERRARRHRLDEARRSPWRRIGSGRWRRELQLRVRVATELLSLLRVQHLALLVRGIGALAAVSLDGAHQREPRGC